MEVAVIGKVVGRYELASIPESAATMIKDSMMRSCATIADYSGPPIDVDVLHQWHDILKDRMLVLIGRIEVVEKSLRAPSDQLGQL